ncbi:histamine N-methyltransferase A-like [Antedon mediterranea]|uniref:histamine N-methyltransferase A-like n=1 Tax=Antedon mediterranea TaxID=105859 RepID=UPI003AF4BB51
MATLVDDKVYYMEGFKLHSLKMGRYKIMEELAKSVFVTSVIEKMDTKDTNIRNLGIGSGNGEIESIFTKQLSDHFGKLENTVIEPAEEAIEEYKRLTAKNNWSNVEYSWFNAENSYSKIVKRFPDIGALQTINCIDVLAVLAVCQESQFQFERYHHECTTDITDFISSDDHPREKKVTIDYLMQTVDFKESVSESLYNEVIDYIKSFDGQILLMNDFDVIFIQKKC